MAFNFHPIRLRIRTIWLRLRVDAYSRQLHAILAQRENDFEAERMLQRDLCTVRSELRKLIQDRQKVDLNRTSLFPNKFIPIVIRARKKGD